MHKTPITPNKKPDTKTPNINPLMNNKKTNTTLSAIAARFTALLLILTMASCTLSMEDWVETEENKGYDELVTEENDFYSVKYQYKDYTRSITDQIREYIVSVEADSVIYFLDNLPEEWTPQVGGCVVANCCTTFPMGLLARVLDVEKEAGMIKVITTPCRLEDAYEDFELDMDMDVMSSKNPQMKSVTRSACPKTRGDGEPDSIITTIDWTMFNHLSKDEKVRCVDGVITRADDDEYFEEDFESDESNTSEITIFSWDSSYGYSKAAITFSHVSQENIKKKVRLKSKYEYTKQTERTGWRLYETMQGGKLDGYEPKKNDQDAIAKRFDAFCDDMMNYGNKIIKDPTKKAKKTINDKHFVVQFPLPALPFAVIIRLTPIGEFEATLIGSFEHTFWGPKTVTEVTVSDGNKTEKEPTEISPKTQELGCTVGGQFKASVGAELFVGVGAVGTGGDVYGLGGFAKLTIDLEGKVNVFQAKTNIEGDLDFSNDSGISLTGNLEVGGKLAAGFFGDFTLASKKFRVWEGFEWKYFPTVAVNDKMPVVYAEDSGGRYKEVKISYTYPHLGFYASLWNRSHHPRLRVYKGADNDQYDDYVDLEPDKVPSYVKTDELYTFTFKTYDVDEDFTAVPILSRHSFHNDKDSYGLFLNNKSYIGKDRMPIVKYFTSTDHSVKGDRMLYMYKSELLKEDDPLYSEVATTYGQKFYIYEFCLPFQFFNACYMKDYWSDFGIKYMIYLNNQANGRYLSLFRKIKSSKAYVPRIKIISDKLFNYSSGNYVTATLYYVNKDDPNQVRRFFDKPEDWMYCWAKYSKHNEEVEGSDNVLYDRASFMFYDDDRKKWDWEKEISKSDFINISK